MNVRDFPESRSRRACQGSLLLLLPRFLGIDGVLLSGAISDGLTAIVVLWVGLREAKNLSKLEAAQAQATGEAP